MWQQAVCYQRRGGAASLSLACCIIWCCDFMSAVPGSGSFQAHSNVFGMRRSGVNGFVPGCACVMCSVRVQSMLLVLTWLSAESAGGTDINIQRPRHWVRQTRRQLCRKRGSKGAAACPLVLLRPHSH